MISRAISKKHATRLSDSCSFEKPTCARFFSKLHFETILLLYLYESALTTKTIIILNRIYKDKCYFKLLDVLDKSRISLLVLVISRCIPSGTIPGMHHSQFGVFCRLKYVCMLGAPKMILQ
jgi:hypothetical protein